MVKIALINISTEQEVFVKLRKIIKTKVCPQFDIYDFIKIVNTFFLK
jgi:hypothetical protein